MMITPIACSSCYGAGYGLDGKPCLSGCRPAALPAAPAPTPICPSNCTGKCPLCRDWYERGLAAPAAPTYTPGEWFDARTLDEMQAFYMARLPAIREAAKEHGYAIGMHGSTRRDFDLMAMQWRDDASDKDTLAHAISVAACGITRDGAFQWGPKPCGRFAVSLPICWTDHANPDFDKPSMGHIDLSIIERPAPAAAEGQAALLSADEIAEVTGRICRYSSERVDFNTLRDEITAVLKSRPLARPAPDGVDARDAKSPNLSDLRERILKIPCVRPDYATGPMRWNWYSTGFNQGIIAAANMVAAPASFRGKEAADAARLEAAAKEIYSKFPDSQSHPWVEGGNSFMQDQARREARAAIKETFHAQ